MAISYQVDGVILPSIRKRDLSKWIRQVAISHAKQVGDVNYMFCDDEKILEVNNQYLQHNYYTDIITFDYCVDDIISGDMLISLDTVKSNSEKFGTQYIEELHRVVIHGILHLCGINDKTEQEEKQMRLHESTALALLENKEEYLHGFPISMV